MSPNSQRQAIPAALSLHRLGIVCGIAAGAWLGAAEVPIKLVGTGLSPFLISLGMVLGAFVGRWTLPTMLKGTKYLAADVRDKPHLIIWAILAGVLWAVANTLTVFAIRRIGLSIAFPLWNTNSIVGLFWGWLLFGELRHAGKGQWLRVLGGASAIVAGACLLAFVTSRGGSQSTSYATGIIAALGASLLWGTMYIPYRKAYISGMNPLSFVTIFTFGELGTILLLVLVLDGGPARVFSELLQAKPVLFWLVLGGFCWVLGDLFQQYAAKYLGLARGIPLSNTNQLWGLAWGALVFGEVSNKSSFELVAILSGSFLTVAGALAIGLAEPDDSEKAAWKGAMRRECERYGLDEARLIASLQGDDSLTTEASAHSWPELTVAAAALGIFLWLATFARPPEATLNFTWMMLLVLVSALILALAAFLLWRRTRFS